MPAKELLVKLEQTVIRDIIAAQNRCLLISFGLGTECCLH